MKQFKVIFKVGGKTHNELVMAYSDITANYKIKEKYPNCVIIKTVENEIRLSSQRN